MIYIIIDTLLTEPRQLYHCFSCSGCHHMVYHRHDKTRDAVIDFIDTQITGAVVEYERMIYRADNPQFHHRSDFTLKLPDSERMIVDVRVTNPGAPSYQASKPDAILSRAEKDKDQQYKETLDNTSNLVPLIMLRTGNIGKRGLAWIDTVGAQSKLGRDLFKTYLLRRLSITLANSLHLAITDFQRTYLPGPRPNMGRWGQMEPSDGGQ